MNILYLKKFIYKLSIIILSLFANKNLGYNETTEFDLLKFPKDGPAIEYI